MVCECRHLVCDERVGALYMHAGALYMHVRGSLPSPASSVNLRNWFGRVGWVVLQSGYIMV